MGVAKVGLRAVRHRRAYRDHRPWWILGFEVFADLKFHDIPNTVNRAAAQVGRAGARWLTVHSVGGPDVLRAGVEGLAEGSDGTAHVLGVTILTSDADRSRACSKSGWRWPATPAVAG